VVSEQWSVRRLWVRGLPGLKIQTWGIRIFYLSDLGHPPVVPCPEVVVS
jgi:hypothetical protein